MRADTDWFLNARWGVFVHYLADFASNSQVPSIDVEDWNARIDGFDVKGLADQLEEIGAGYFFITLGRTPDSTCRRMPPTMPSSGTSPAAAPSVISWPTSSSSWSRAGSG